MLNEAPLPRCQISVMVSEANHDTDRQRNLVNKVLRPARTNAHGHVLSAPVQGEAEMPRNGSLPQKENTMAQQTATAGKHVVSLKANLLVFGALLALLALTLVAAQLDLGPLNGAIALAIAAAKALLIILYFMHVRFSGRLAWVFAAAGFVWLAIMVGLTMADYVSRGWFGLPPAPLG